MTDRELMQQALEALEQAQRYGAGEWSTLTNALRKHLVQQAPRPDYRDWDYQDQLEQSPLDRMAENARELGLDYEPVQKEKPDGRQTTGPLTDRTDHVRNGDDYMPEPVGEIVQAFADLTAVSIPVMPPVGTKLYTTPPRCPNCASLEAQNTELDAKLAGREWQGLTDEEHMVLYVNADKGLHKWARAIEAKLREKNA